MLTFEKCCEVVKRYVNTKCYYWHAQTDGTDTENQASKWTHNIG